MKKILILLGAIAATVAIAPPVGAIATPPGPAGHTGTSATTSPVVSPPHRVHVKSHHSQTADQGTPLVGVFSISTGSCSSGTPTGTYFRMIEPGGALSGPFLSNANSPCAVQTYTPMSPGTAGGLSTVTYQPSPTPAFDSGGNGLANSIPQPQEFFGVDFALSTDSTDPQTGLGVAVPSISNSSGTLSGNLEAISVGWNKQYFNQGSPKPGGSTPGLTTVPTGTYDSSTGAFTLTWSSAIVGGPFNNFTGLWHLQGIFIPSSSTPPPTTTTTPPPTTGISTSVAPGSQTGSSTGASTTSTTPGASQSSGTRDDPSAGKSATLAMTGLGAEGVDLLLVALALVASGICLLLFQRSRGRKIAR